MQRLSLSKTFGDDAAEVRAVLEMFGGQGAEIVSAGGRKTGAELAREGMAQAGEHAEAVCPGWSDMAVDAVRRFCKEHPASKFRVEVVREWAVDIIPVKCLRAWGPVICKAERLGIVRNTGDTERVRNPRAHEANAALWMPA